jgi:hypothetical protein
VYTPASLRPCLLTPSLEASGAGYFFDRLLAHPGLAPGSTVAPSRMGRLCFKYVLLDMWSFSCLENLPCQAEFYVGWILAVPASIIYDMSLMRLGTFVKIPWSMFFASPWVLQHTDLAGYSFSLVSCCVLWYACASDGWAPLVAPGRPWSPLVASGRPLS